MDNRTELDLIRAWSSMVDKRGNSEVVEGSGEDFTTCGDLDLDNQVAKILLDTAQDQLPSWSCVNQEGEYVEARRRSRIKSRQVQLLPQHLFSINWASSGPGFEWPEAYYVTYVPQLDMRIVTASQDSNDIWGVTDLAIGKCRAVRTPGWGTKKIITSWWKRARGAEPMPWERLDQAGLITEERTWKWRKDVWGSREYGGW